MKPQTVTYFPTRRAGAYCPNCNRLCRAYSRRRRGCYIVRFHTCGACKVELETAGLMYSGFKSVEAVQGVQCVGGGMDTDC